MVMDRIGLHKSRLESEALRRFVSKLHELFNVVKRFPLLYRQESGSFLVDSKSEGQPPRSQRPTSASAIRTK